MNKIILATGSTFNYIEKIMPYLVSINKNSNFDKNILITLDCEYNFLHLNKIETHFLSNKNILSKSKINCLQHGEFLKCSVFEQFEEKDYICFTDGDIVMQRSLNDDEVAQIFSLKDDDVLLQYNENKEDSLMKEAIRLNFKLPIDESFKNYSCFNTGVVVCNIKTWKKIMNLYNYLFPILKNISDHYALQQWIISYIVTNLMHPVVCDYSFHMHHHYGFVEGNHLSNNLYCYKNKVVLFAHFMRF